MDAVDGGEEDIPTTTLTLVGEEDLEGTLPLKLFLPQPTSPRTRCKSEVRAYIIRSRILPQPVASHGTVYIGTCCSATHSPIHLHQDAGLICDPSVIVHKADAKDPTSSIALGRVVGPDVKVSPILWIASSVVLNES